MTFPVEVTSLADFSEEIKAVAAAKCSRSHNTFLEDAMALTAEKAASAHETIVVGYGHNSVADMSMGSLCFEGISTLLAETVFDIQTGKFQGKSSRYVAFKRENVVRPVTAEDDPEWVAWYEGAIAFLFDAYETLRPLVHKWVISQPEMAGAKAAVVNARVFDAVRYLLPLGSMTNVGTRLSSRDTSELNRVLLASPLAEAQDLAAKIKVAAVAETPTLIRHTELNELYRDLKCLPVNLIDESVNESGYHGWVGIELEDRYRGRLKSVIDTLFFEAGYLRRKLVYGTAAFATQHRGIKCFNEFMARRKSRHDPLPHALRAARFTFHLQTDFGTWKDLRRHRRCELFREPQFTARLGYTVPEDIVLIGGDVELLYRAAMDRATTTWSALAATRPAEAQYGVTHGHIQAWSWDLDLEELVYVAELRTEVHGHISYRRIAWQMLELARATDVGVLLEHVHVHPVTGPGVHV